MVREPSGAVTDRFGSDLASRGAQGAGEPVQARAVAGQGSFVNNPRIWCSVQGELAAISVAVGESGADVTFTCP